MRAGRWWAALVALVVVLTPAPAQARAARCDQVPRPGAVNRELPYEDQLYDLPRLASLASGAGVRVAVVDSGVDARHPQLEGRVAVGRDLLHGNPDGRQDCIGHGTAVASIIAASPQVGVPFHGLAPGATIVPVRITEKETIDGREVGKDGSPAQFAEAISWAASRGGGNARVINLSVVMTRDNAAVRRAVERAVADGVVVVAAAGNSGRPGDPNLTPYPAAYSGVIGVGAVDGNGVRASFSQHGAYVDIVAAGTGVTAATPGSGHGGFEGTSFATPFVAATAALILQREPQLTPEQVQRRLVATADPAPGGGRSDEYGFGLLNPYRAVTETLGPERVPSPVAAADTGEDPASVALRARRERSQQRALVFGLAGLGLVALVALVGAVIRRGRRRDWHPA
ncbi:type VII secretion-associated serine protease mycosin [Actinoplanes sp. NPDC049265]|uniref:type VII secretion-associated serine protease mycosin n=1 Tax=Actinoplanes sp. NPDC049265 TaxID=3363902 RepID=UPI003720C60D